MTNNPTYISGQQAWDKLISLDYTGENSYHNFFRDWDIFYRPHWASLGDGKGKTKEEPIQVSFNWIIHRQYNAHGYQAVENPPYYELCVSMPPDSRNKHFPTYRAPRFFWNNKRGLSEIFLAPKIDFQI
jgi:hypothetical protein